MQHRTARRAGGRRLGARALAVLIALTPSVAAQPRTGAVLDRLEAIRRETGAPGVSAAVALEGEMAFSGGVGWAEIQNQTPGGSATVHNVAVVSQLMTTVALLQLVEEGTLDLDDRLQRHLPSVPARIGAVTLGQILTHTSGLRDWYGPTKVDSFDGLVAAIEDAPAPALLFEPGAAWSPSAYGFDLLPGVIEQASGTGFEQLLRANVWEPAGMFRTSFDIPSRIVPRRGRGYAREADGTLVHARWRSHAFRHASGGMLSTVENLVRLGIALDDGTLLSPAMAARMLEVRVTPGATMGADATRGEPPRGQGIGWWTDVDEAGRRYAYAGGGVSGVESVLIYYPDAQLVVALLANLQPFDARAFGQVVGQMFLDD